MERVPELLKSKIMSADQAAQFIQTGMTIGVSGFTSVGYPKAVPEALVRSGHARDLTICVGAAVGDEIDGAMVRAGLVKSATPTSRIRTCAMPSTPARSATVMCTSRIFPCT